MKNSFTLTILFFFCFSFANSQNKWGLSGYSLSGPYNVVIEQCGDTLVDGFVYDRFISTYFSSDSVISKPILTGFTRNVDDKIFFRLPQNIGNPDSTDKLLYDFSVETGDTLNLDVLTEGNFDFLVTEVDTVFLLNRERKRIKIERIVEPIIITSGSATGITSKDTWVEGIGSLGRGYFQRGQTDDYEDDLIELDCFFSMKENAIYTISNSLNCNLENFTSSCEISDWDPKFQNIAFPNPFSDFIQIGHLQINGMVKIYNILGQEVASYTIDNQPIRINTNFLSAGVYILSIQDEPGILINKKMIKQD